MLIEMDFYPRPVFHSKELKIQDLVRLGIGPLSPILGVHIVDGF